MTAKQLPTAHVIKYAAGIFGFAPKKYRAQHIVDVAKTQLGIKRISDYPLSLGHMLITAAHDVQKGNLKPAIVRLVQQRNALPDLVP